jgi:hypothetical protein
MFPQAGIVEVSAVERVWSGDDDAVGIAAQASVHGGECQRLGRRELEAGGDQILARDVLEIVPAREDIAHAGGQCGLAPPIELDFAQAVVADDAGAEIGTRKLGLGRGRALDRVVDRGVDRFER